MFVFELRITLRARLLGSHYGHGSDENEKRNECVAKESLHAVPPVAEV
jgi:hypothetical protein